jgi:ribonuclease HI
MITAHFDGACEPVNPGGTGSYAFIVFDNDNKVIYHEAKIICPSYYFLPNTVFKPTTSSVNVSEYAACICLMTYLLQNGYREESILVYGDSKLVINQMSDIWKIGQGHYLFLAHYCKEVLLKLFKDIKFRWFSGEDNFMADKLSKDVLKDAGIEISNWKENPGYWIGRTKKIKKEKKLENE